MRPIVHLCALAMSLAGLSACEGTCEVLIFDILVVRLNGLDPGGADCLEAAVYPASGGGGLIGFDTCGGEVVDDESGYTGAGVERTCSGTTCDYIVGIYPQNLEDLTLDLTRDGMVVGSVTATATLLAKDIPKECTPHERFVYLAEFDVPEGL